MNICIRAHIVHTDYTEMQTIRKASMDWNGIWSASAGAGSTGVVSCTLNNKFHWKLFYRQINVRTLCDARQNMQCAMCEPMHKSVRFRAWWFREDEEKKIDCMVACLARCCCDLVWYIMYYMHAIFVHRHIQHPTSNIQHSCMENEKGVPFESYTTIESER